MSIIGMVNISDLIILPLSIFILSLKPPMLKTCSCLTSQYWMAGLVSMEDQDLDTIGGFLTLAAGPPSKCCRDEAIAVRC